MNPLRGILRFWDLGDPTHIEDPGAGRVDPLVVARYYAEWFAYPLLAVALILTLLLTTGRRSALAVRWAPLVTCAYGVLFHLLGLWILVFIPLRDPAHAAEIEAYTMPVWLLLGLTGLLVASYQLAASLGQVVDAERRVAAGLREVLVLTILFPFLWQVAVWPWQVWRWYAEQVQALS